MRQGAAAGEDKGRIYRVRRKGVALRAVPRLDRADAAGLVAALESPKAPRRRREQRWRVDLVGKRCMIQ